MKKALLLVVLSLILFTSLKPTMASTSDVPYSGYAERSDYDRIEKIDGQWYGVITASEIRIFAVNETIELPFTGIPFINNSDTYHYFVEFKLTRETQYLKSITLEFEIDPYCPYFTCLFGGRVDVYSGTRTFTYDESSLGLEEGTTLEEAFGDGNITTSIDDQYDYVVNLDHTTKNEISDSEIKILEFTYVLSDEEVQDLMLDIQAQYEQEYYQIITNDFLTASEKQNAINMLNNQYSDYDVNFGDEMTSPCVGEGCEDDLAGTPELPYLGVIVNVMGFFEGLIPYIPDGQTLIAYIILILIVGYITGTIIYRSTQKVLYSTIDGIAMIAKSIILTIVKAIWFYIEALISGIASILSSIFK